MTANRRSKRGIRSRMEQTGEKYTEARRALLTSGGSEGVSGEDPGVAIRWPEDSLGWFTDQAHNAILLADDEARMLSHPIVEPEHLLLAAARYGNVQWLLASQDINARAIHDVILQITGSGDRLELRPRRSPASEEVLRRAVAAATARGILGPSTEHLLVALGEQELTARILSELGVESARALVDAAYPVTQPPVDRATIERRASQLSGHGSAAPSPGPIPPIFERFTSQARDAINAGIEYARKLDDPSVEPAHLLFGVLNAKAGLVATVRTKAGWHIPPAEFVQPRYPRATGIFSPDARRIVAEDVLLIAERLDCSAITTGHLLIAILERRRLGPDLGRRDLDEHASEMIRSLPDIREITEAVIDAPPGSEDS
jgi:ATP-dependent Clp protease ATP-binding subunit ClpA